MKRKEGGAVCGQLGNRVGILLIFITGGQKKLWLLISGLRENKLIKKSIDLKCLF